MIPVSPRAAHAMTDFGNIVVAGPLIIIMIGWLHHHTLRMVATALALNTALAVTSTILLKLLSQHIGGAFFGEPWRLTTGAPSGHAAVSSVVYGSIGVLFVLRATGPARWLGAASALIIITVVSITRITLGYHSPADVMAGLILGIGFAALTLLVARASEHKWPPMLPLLAVLVTTAVVLQLTGLRLDSNAIL